METPPVLWHGLETLGFARLGEPAGLWAAGASGGGGVFRAGLDGKSSTPLHRGAGAILGVPATAARRLRRRPDSAALPLRCGSFSRTGPTGWQSQWQGNSIACGLHGGPTKRWGTALGPAASASRFQLACFGSARPQSFKQPSRARQPVAIFPLTPPCPSTPPAAKFSREHSGAGNRVYGAGNRVYRSASMRGRGVFKPSGSFGWNPARPPSEAQPGRDLEHPIGVAPYCSDSTRAHRSASLAGAGTPNGRLRPGDTAKVTPGRVGPGGFGSQK